jgi:predicted transposase YdaD
MGSIMTKTTTIHQPLDKFFKEAMSYPSIAEHFFKAHLPPELLNQVDFDTLQLCQNNFITKAYRAREADVVYSMSLAGQPAYFYALTENQGTNQHLMPFRFVGYDVDLTRAHLKKYPNSKTLPIVYHMLLYTGLSPWRSPMTLSELYKPHEALAHLRTKPYHLIELNQYTYEQLQQQGVLGFVQFALKSRQFERQALEQFIERLTIWLHDIRIQLDENFFEMVLDYLLYGVPEAQTQRTYELFDKITQHLSTQFRGKVMTLAESLKYEGREEGRALGREEGMELGIEQGMQRKELEIARGMLLKGLDPTLIQEITHLSDEALEKLLETA